MEVNGTWYGDSCTVLVGGGDRPMPWLASRSSDPSFQRFEYEAIAREVHHARQRLPAGCAGKVHVFDGDIFARLLSPGKGPIEFILKPDSEGNLPSRPIVLSAMPPTGSFPEIAARTAPPCIQKGQRQTQASYSSWTFRLFWRGAFRIGHVSAAILLAANLLALCG